MLKVTVGSFAVEDPSLGGARLLPAPRIAKDQVCGDAGRGGAPNATSLGSAATFSVVSMSLFGLIEITRSTKLP